MQNGTFPSAAPKSVVDTTNTGDTAWILTSTAFVLLMTAPGLALFYGGLVNRKNVVNMMAMSIFTALIIAIEWVLFGYSLSFAPGTSGMGDFRWGGFKDVGELPNVDYAATVPHILFATYQMMFAIITPALISGAVVGRMKLSTWCVFVVIWHVVVYDLIAHMVWGSWTESDGSSGAPIQKMGWLKSLGALDFAGGTVVHMTSGFSALAASYVLGQRKLIVDNPKFEDRPYNIGLIATGTGLLWVGWFGFNAGSALGANGLASVAFANTAIAPASAGLVWFLLDILIRKNGASLVAAATGVVIGLVSITPAAGYVVPGYSIIIGAVTAGFGYAMLWFKRYLQTKAYIIAFDDTLDAFAVHGIGGVLGAFMTGLFATKSVNPLGADGAFYGNPALLGWQCLSIVITIIISVGLTAAILLIMRFIPFFGIRVNGEEEYQGLDRTFHKEIIDTYDFADATEGGQAKIVDESSLPANDKKMYKTREEEDEELRQSVQKKGHKRALTRNATKKKGTSQPNNNRNGRGTVRNIMNEISTSGDTQKTDDEESDDEEEASEIEPDTKPGTTTATPMTKSAVAAAKKAAAKGLDEDSGSADDNDNSGSADETETESSSSSSDEVAKKPKKRASAAKKAAAVVSPSAAKKAASPK